MTLIVSLVNADQVIQISDRRISRPGFVITDESNKAGVLSCADARFAFGYTGLANVGSFNTMQWLLEALYDSGPPEYTCYALLERFRERASRDFRTLAPLRNLPSEHKRLTIMLSGYQYTCEPSRGMCIMLSNYQNFEAGTEAYTGSDEFKPHIWYDRQPELRQLAMIHRIGAWPAMTAQDIMVLNKLLQERKPAKAIIGKGLEMFRTMTDRRTAAGTIGKQISVVTLPSAREAAPEAKYHSDIVSTSMFWPSHVTAISNDYRFIIGELKIQLHTAEGPTTTVVPKVGRNAPCPCGSGQKYKRCHGRLEHR